MRRYRAGIIGLTGIGAGRSLPAPGSALQYPAAVSHAGACAALPEVELVSVCDLDPAALDRFRESWSDVFAGTAAYRDYRAMLAEMDLDLLSVCTPDNRHADMVIDACAAGVRAIFCEKPIATTLEDADRMIAACQKAGVAMSVDHTRRWYPMFTMARERLRAGDIGPITRIVATLGGPRAMLFRNGTHLVDTVLMMADSEPEWVFAELDEGHEKYYRYQGDGGRDPGGDPGGSGYIHFRSGARAFLNASKGTPSGFSLDIFGENGRLLVSDQEGVVLTTGGSSRRLREPYYRLTGIAAGMEELIRCMEGRCPAVACPPATARQGLRVLLAMLRSQELGSARVSLDE